MGRLIDADKLILNLNDYSLQETPKENESTSEQRISRMVYQTIQNCIRAVEEQPTAYDVDVVAEQISRSAFERIGNLGMGGEKVVNLDDAIEIVKEGGSK